MFTTIQPCIRTGDFGRIKRDSDDYTRMTLFHMLPVPFRLEPTQDRMEQLHRECLWCALEFLTRRINLDLKRIRISYFSGGRLDRISGSTVTTDRFFAPDEITVTTCKDFGMRADQLLPEVSPNTFLISSPVDSKFYSGYRFEIYYQMSDTLSLEIGTGEILPWRQVQHNGVITDIDNSGCLVAAVGVGLERCLMASNEFHRIDMCDHISPLVQDVSGSSSATFRDSFRFVDAIRALHLIIADGGTIDTLNRRRRDHYRALLKVLTEIAARLSLSDKMLIRVLTDNGRLQPWLQELSGSEETVQHEVAAYRDRQ